jgi:hypothetical protein
MQTKKRSLFEVGCNTATGILTAYLAWTFIIIKWAEMLCWDLNHLGVVKVVTINGVFTVISVVRGYFWRRTFNRHD